LLEDKNPGMLNEGKYSTNEKLRSTLTICYSASKLSNFMKFMAKDTAVQHTAIFEAKKKVIDFIQSFIYLRQGLIM
jgi:hypothetical protein